MEEEIEKNVNILTKKIFNDIKGQCTFTIEDVSEFVSLYSKLRYQEWPSLQSINSVSNDQNSITLKYLTNGQFRAKGKVLPERECLIQVIIKTEIPNQQKIALRKSQSFQKALGNDNLNTYKLGIASQLIPKQLSLNNYKTFSLSDKFHIYSLTNNNENQDVFFFMNDIKENNYSLVKQININTYFYEKEFQKFKQIISNCINLQKLRIDIEKNPLFCKHSIIIQGLQYILFEHQKLKILEIYFDFSRLQTNDIVQLGIVITKCKSISQVKLHQFNEPSQRQRVDYLNFIFHNEIQDCKNIRNVNLKTTGEVFSNDTIKQITILTNGLSKLTNLQILKISQLKIPFTFSCGSAAALADCLGKLHHLIELSLDLSDSAIDILGYEHLSKGFEMCINLRKLNLNMNFNSELIINDFSLMKSISSCSQLRSLKLTRKYFDDLHYYLSLPSLLMKLKYLNFFQLKQDYNRSNQHETKLVLKQLKRKLQRLVKCRILLIQ